MTWSLDQITLLRSLWEDGETIYEIAKKVGHTPAACRFRAFTLGLRSSRTRKTHLYGGPAAFERWSRDQEDVREFIQHWRGAATLKEIGEIYGRSARAVSHYARSLSLGPRGAPADDDALPCLQPPPAPRLKTCRCCEVRRPLGRFEGTSRICLECIPSGPIAADLPVPRDPWGDERPIGNIFIDF